MKEKTILHIEYMDNISKDAIGINLENIDSSNIYVGERIIRFGDELVINLDNFVMYQFRKVQA